MDTGVEHIVDLGLVNYVPHPSNPNYVVFRFADKKRADHFEELLKEKNIWFEKDTEQTKRKFYYLFGVSKRDFRSVQSINFAVESKNRSFLIPNAYFRWLVLLISVGMVVLAVVGYCMRPDLMIKPD
ncbi:MAG: hypothetical protein R3277_13260 [Brumimicrobium sp.]|nr:hypothetical protein [Brumimicrobium sp.]